MTPSRYPGAKWLGNGVPGGAWTDGPWRVVLHTTETRTIPGYVGGKNAPHLTYFPAGRYAVQHTGFDAAARAMVNGPDPVQTNRDRALQMEIVCYSAGSIAKSVGGLWVGDLTDDHLADIAAFLRWARDQFGVRLGWRGKTALSYAEANKTGYRMTTKEWDKFDGVARHQDVPDGNVHWDTGALDMARLIAIASGAGTGDDMAVLTDAEQLRLRRLLTNLDGIGSNEDFVKVLVPWFRKLTGLTPEALKELEESPELAALDARLDELVVQSGVPLGVPVRITRA